MVKFEDMIKENIEFKQIRLSDYFQQSFNFNYEPYYTHLNSARAKGAKDAADNENNDSGSFISNPFKESFIS